MEEYHQRRLRPRRSGLAGIARRIEVGMARLPFPAGGAQRFRPRQLRLGQGLLAAGQYLHGARVAPNRQQRRQAVGSRGDAVETLGIGAQLAETAEGLGQAPFLSICIALHQHAVAVLETAEQQSAVRQRQVAARAQLPRRRRVVGRYRVQRLPNPVPLAPGLPPTQAVGQRMQPDLDREARLLHGLVPGRQNGRRRPAAGGVPHRHAQAGRGPGLFGTAPFDPGQPLAVRAQARRRVEVGALGQHLALPTGQGQTHQAMHNATRLMALFHRQQRVAGRGEMQIAITAAALCGQRTRLVIQRLAVDLLVRLVDESHAVAGQAEGTAAVLIDPAAQRDAGRRQALGLPAAPEPEGAAAVLGTVFEPEQAAMPGAQFGEVAARRSGALGRPGAGPEAIGNRSAGHTFTLVGRMNSPLPKPVRGSEFIREKAIRRSGTSIANEFAPTGPSPTFVINEPKGHHLNAIPVATAIPHGHGLADRHPAPRHSSA